MIEVESQHRASVRVEIPKGVSLSLAGTASTGDDVYTIRAESAESAEDAVAKIREAGERIAHA